MIYTHNEEERGVHRDNKTWTIKREFKWTWKYYKGGERHVRMREKERITPDTLTRSANHTPILCRLLSSCHHHITPSHHAIISSHHIIILLPSHPLPSYPITLALCSFIRYCPHPGRHDGASCIGAPMVYKSRSSWSRTYTNTYTCAWDVSTCK
jgi:hypothetical protein